MQSGPGKHCDEKYNALQQYSGQTSARKFVPSLQLPDFLSKIQRRLPPETIDELIEEAEREERKVRPAVEKQRVSQTWAFSTLSRQDYYKAVERKDRVPSLGYYVPKYTSIYPSTMTPVIPHPPFTKRKHIDTSRPSEAGPIPEYPRRIPTATVFSLQTKRPDPTKTTHTVSDQRFEVLPEPLVYSKIKRVVSPNLSKSLRRNTLIRPVSSPRYDPKFGAVWKKDLPTIDFGKLTGRSEDAFSPTIHLSYENVRFSQTSPRTSTASFKTSRPSKELPAHMVGVTSRMGLTVLQQSSLVMSGFPFHPGSARNQTAGGNLRQSFRAN